jgi:hypothetical protein
VQDKVLDLLKELTRGKLWSFVFKETLDLPSSWLTSLKEIGNDRVGKLFKLNPQRD